MWDLSPETRDQWEIDRNELQFVRKLGSGNFGEVWYGEFTNKKLFMLLLILNLLYPSITNPFCSKS